MAKKNDEEEVPEHVRKAQQKFLEDEKNRKGEPEKTDHYAIDWKTGKPLKDPKYKP